MFGVYLVFSSCFKQNIVVIVSRCSQKPACYRNDVAASCFTADCESSGHMLISYLFLKQKRRFSIKLLKNLHLLFVSFTRADEPDSSWLEKSTLKNVPFAAVIKNCTFYQALHQQHRFSADIIKSEQQ